MAIQEAYDEQTGIVKSTAVGILTVDEIRRSHKEIVTFMARGRAKFGRGRHLVDARESPVQPREVMAEYERLGSCIEHPVDRMAIVVSSALAKLQSRRAIDARNPYPEAGEIFLSEDEARAWLLRP